MKYKLAVPSNVLNGSEIDALEVHLVEGLMPAVRRNFPNWQQRAAETIGGGEIILQQTDMTRPVHGLKPGIHLTISLISYMPERNFKGLADDVISLIKATTDGDGRAFMANVGVFLQMTMDRPVILNDDGTVTPSSEGVSLLEFSD